MIAKEIFDSFFNGTSFMKEFFDILNKEKSAYCVIGGIAVNCYAKPVYSEDLDVVILMRDLKNLLPKLKDKFKVEHFANDYNISKSNSDLRIQITIDERYQSFINRAIKKNIFGMALPVANIDDVFQGKIWASTDPDRRPSKSFKDKSDIMRLIETKNELKYMLPEELKKELKILVGFPAAMPLLI